MGTDVSVVGIFDHEIYQRGKELRLLKGHISLAAKTDFSELNFAIPKGMSGGPVLVEDKCIGFLSGSIRSEKVDEQIEEIVETEDNNKKITYIESKKIIYFGLFVPFSYFFQKKFDIFGNKSLDEIILDKISY